LEAGLEFSQVVVTNHAIEESGSKFRDTQDIDTNFGCIIEWHKELNCCSSVLSSIEVFVS
jgi:hypothetical protein